MASAFDYLPADEPLRAKLSPLVFVEPKDKGAASEDARQAEYVATMRRLAKRVLVHAIPNGGKRSHWAAMKAKREGMLKGWPDTEATWTAATAYIEFKAGSTMPDADQIEILNRLADMGHPVAVCRTAAGAIGWLRGLGAPVPAIAA
jgi:hypothetical protein